MTMGPKRYQIKKTAHWPHQNRLANTTRDHRMRHRHTIPELKFIFHNRRFSRKLGAILHHRITPAWTYNHLYFLITKPIPRQHRYVQLRATITMLRLIWAQKHLANAPSTNAIPHAAFPQTWRKTRQFTGPSIFHPLRRLGQFLWLRSSDNSWHRQVRACTRWA